MFNVERTVLPLLSLTIASQIKATAQHAKSTLFVKVPISTVNKLFLLQELIIWCETCTGAPGYVIWHETCTRAPGCYRKGMLVESCH